MTQHELRYDALTGEWVAIVGDRQDRPNLPASGCPFCVGGLESPDRYTVRAFPNRWPPLVPGDPIGLQPSAAEGVFATRPPRGAAEVVLYTPEHTGSLATIGIDGVRAVVDLWAARTAALLERPEIAYVLVFENRGAEVGATISHPHGQIYGFPAVPPLPAREAAVAAASETCPVCDLVPAEVAAGTRIVYTTAATGPRTCPSRPAIRSPPCSPPAPTSATCRASTTPVATASRQRWWTWSPGTTGCTTRRSPT